MEIVIIVIMTVANSAGTFVIPTAAVIIESIRPETLNVAFIPSMAVLVKLPRIS